MTTCAYFSTLNIPPWQQNPHCAFQNVSLAMESSLIGTSQTFNDVVTNANIMTCIWYAHNIIVHLMMCVHIPPVMCVHYFAMNCEC